MLTDPSCASQVVAFTYPQIRNYGVAPDDDESHKPEGARSRFGTHEGTNA